MADRNRLGWCDTVDMGSGLGMDDGLGRDTFNGCNTFGGCSLFDLGAAVDTSDKLTGIPGIYWLYMLIETEYKWLNTETINYQLTTWMTSKCLYYSLPLLDLFVDCVRIYNQ